MLHHHQTNGFFFECGAYDGEAISNTLYMERFLNWTGVLVEAHDTSYRKLLAKKRKSWSLPVCLSLQPYPTQVSAPTLSGKYLYAVFRL